jgi:myosin heavy subunit
VAATFLAGKHLNLWKSASNGMAKVAEDGLSKHTDSIFKALDLPSTAAVTEVAPAVEKLNATITTLNERVQSLTAQLEAAVTQGGDDAALKASKAKLENELTAAQAALKKAEVDHAAALNKQQSVHQTEKTTLKSQHQQAIAEKEQQLAAAQAALNKAKTDHAAALNKQKGVQQQLKQTIDEKTAELKQLKAEVAQLKQSQPSGWGADSAVGESSSVSRVPEPPPPVVEPPTPVKPKAVDPPPTTNRATQALPELPEGVDRKVVDQLIADYKTGKIENAQEFSESANSIHNRRLGYNKPLELDQAGRNKGIMQSREDGNYLIVTIKPTLRVNKYNMETVESVFDITNRSDFRQGSVGTWQLNQPAVFNKDLTLNTKGSLTFVPA